MSYIAFLYNCASFAALVARYSGDITLSAVLDELERVSVVGRPDKNAVELRSAGNVPQADDLEKNRIMSVSSAGSIPGTTLIMDSGSDVYVKSGGTSNATSVGGNVGA